MTPRSPSGPAPASHSPSRWRRIRGAVALAGLAATASAVVYLIPPYEGAFGGCPVLTLTGLYCPLCGGLRSTHELLHGNVTTAFALHPFVPVLLASAVAIWLVWFVRRWRGSPIRWNPPNWAMWSLLAALALFMVVRNLPGMEALTPG